MFENWSIFDEVIRRTKMCHFATCIRTKRRDNQIEHSSKKGPLWTTMLSFKQVFKSPSRVIRLAKTVELSTVYSTVWECTLQWVECKKWYTDYLLCMLICHAVYNFLTRCNRHFVDFRRGWCSRLRAKLTVIIYYGCRCGCYCGCQT